ncbi:hypothetical protein J6590_055975 [Homalodisca vitripennis]|nr:hypothetical protein J6590_055975 [Homalodisca vitripennis]
MLTTFGYAFANDSFLVHPKYLTHEEVDELFKSLEKSYGNLTKVHSIGKSVLGRDLLVLEVYSNVHERRPLKPMFNVGYECCHESKIPDDAVFKALALRYASKNPLMHAGNSCETDNLYWRLLLPGDYELRALAPGYEATNWTHVKVEENKTSVLNTTVTNLPEGAIYGISSLKDTSLLAKSVNNLTNENANAERNIVYSCSGHHYFVLFFV